MEIIADKKLIYSGRDSDDFYKFKINVQGKSLEVNYSQLDLLKDTHLSESEIDHLYTQNLISKNQISGYNSKEGLSLYFLSLEGKKYIFSLGEKQPGLHMIYLEAVFNSEKKKQGSDKSNQRKQYHQFLLADDANVIGSVYPQIDGFYSVGKVTNRKDYEEYYAENIPDKLDLHNFRFNTQAKLTDFISTQFLRYNGFFLRREIKGLLKNFEFENSKFIEATLYHGKNAIDVYYLNVLEADVIDYRKSVFEIIDFDGSKIDEKISFTSADNYEERSDEIFDNDLDQEIKPVSIVPRKFPDFFKLYATNDYYISYELENHLAENGVTGYAIRSQDCIK